MFQRHGFRFWGQDRMFQKGDFKYLILDLLRDKPYYGYEIIRELEGRFHGFYSPSPGTVYPTLQYLEDMGYVTSNQQDGKRIYTITEQGLKFLDDQKDVVNEIKSQMRNDGGFWSSDLRNQFHDAMHEMRDLGRLVAQRARRINGENLRKIRDVLGEAYKKIEKIITEDPNSHV